jgi:hypothetical protein
MSETNVSFVAEIIAPDSDSGTSLVVSKPEWADIEKAIHRLDGARYCELALMTREATGISIFGGWQGRYTCELIAESENGACLVSPNGRRDVLVNVTEGGEDSPEMWAVGLVHVPKAAKTYAETGELDETLVWER